MDDYSYWCPVCGGKMVEEETFDYGLQYVCETCRYPYNEDWED